MQARDNGGIAHRHSLLLWQQTLEERPRLGAGLTEVRCAWERPDQDCAALAEVVLDGRDGAVAIPAGGLAGTGAIHLLEITAADGAAAYPQLKVLQEIRRKVHVRFGGPEDLGETEIRLRFARVGPVTEIPGEAFADQRTARLDIGAEP